MAVIDAARASRGLHFIGYHRLQEYWRSLEVPAVEGEENVFRAGASLDDALALYAFDRRLRLLALDAIERAEVALRGIWVRHMVGAYGAHGYADRSMYHHEGRHGKAMSKLREKLDGVRAGAAAGRGGARRADAAWPPVWVAAERISFGRLSNSLSNLRHRSDRRAVARPFGLEERGFMSCVRHMNAVRNICAHHERLWDKRFAIRMATRTFPAGLQQAMRDADFRKLHNTLVMLDYLLSAIAPRTPWRRCVVALLDGCPQADPRSMGFPRDWRSRSVWRV